MYDLLLCTETVENDLVLKMTPENKSKTLHHKSKAFKIKIVQLITQRKHWKMTRPDEITESFAIF